MAQQQDTVAAMSNDDVQLLKNLIKKRGSVKFRITHVKKYLDRIESDLSVLSELDKAELRQKSSRMPQLFDEFASIQCEIETLSDSSDQFEERIEFENSYDLCMARINCILTNDGFDNDSKRSDKSGVSLHHVLLHIDKTKTQPATPQAPASIPEEPRNSNATDFETPATNGESAGGSVALSAYSSTNFVSVVNRVSGSDGRTRKKVDS
nr:unnamed protein product [Callosobruchus analis]